MSVLLEPQVCHDGTGELTGNPALVAVVAEGVARAEGGCSDLLHIPPLQSQTGAASGDDGATDPRSELHSADASGAQVLLEVIRGLHVGLSVILRSGSGAELLEPPEVP